MSIDPFWKWVADKPDADTPRGDFIRDTRHELGSGRDPDIAIVAACSEAREQYRALRLEWWNRSTARPREETHE